MISYFCKSCNGTRQFVEIRRYWKEGIQKVIYQCSHCEQKIMAEEHITC